MKIQIKNLTDTNKRIRLTALDGAVANIDNSVKADLAILTLFNGTILT